MEFGEMTVNILVKFRMVIFSVFVVSYGFTGFARNGKIHDKNLSISSAICLDSMGGKQSENNPRSRLGEFIITDEGIGPIQLGYQFRDFVDFFSPKDIKMYRSEPEGLGWVTYAEITMDGGNSPQIVVSSSMIEYGDKTSDLDMTVAAIAILRGDFETERGIKIGSSIEELLSKYELEATSYFDGGMGEGEYIDPYLLIEVQELADVDFIVENVKFDSETPHKEELPRSAIIKNIAIQRYFDLMNNNVKDSLHTPVVDTTRAEIDNFYDTPVVDTTMVEDEIFFNSDSFENIMMEDMEGIVANAQNYYRKPANMGGGGNSFTGYTIPNRLSEGGFGVYSLVSVKKNSIELEGFLQDESGILGRTLTITIIFDQVEVLSTKISYN